MPILIGSLIKSKTSLTWKWYNVSRQLLALALVLVALADLALVAVRSADNKLTADLVNALIELLFAVSIRIVLDGLY